MQTQGGIIVTDKNTYVFYRSHFDFGDFDAYRSADNRFRFDLNGELVTPQQLADYLDAQYVQVSEAGIHQAVSHYSELRGLPA